MSRVLIAGCGYVGSALARLLVADGETVFGLKRRPSDLPEGVTPVAADLSRPETLSILPDAIDVLVYAVGAGEPTERAYRTAYVEGPRTLLQFLARREDPVQRVLFVSSTGVYAQNDGGWVDETSPTEPTDFTGRCLLEGEQSVLRGPYPSTVLRLAGIYGPGRTWMVRRVFAGEASLSATPRYSNRIHRDDCAGALRHLLRLDAPRSLYLGSDHDPADLNEVVAWLADRLGVAPPAPAGSSPAAPGSRGNKRCRNDLLIASGYRFLYPTYREGYENVVRDFLATEGLDRSNE